MECWMLDRKHSHDTLNELVCWSKIDEIAYKYLYTVIKYIK